ncbi:MAG: DUF2169 domain-containing protein [Polyangiaceae bacterium]
MNLVAFGPPNLVFWFVEPWAGFKRGASPPFGATVMLDPEGREIQIVVVKVTTNLVDGRPLPEEQQTAIRYADRFNSGGQLEEASDFALSRSGTSICVDGSVVSPTAVNSLDARIKVGKLQVDLRVFGERRWSRVDGAWRPTEPHPFTHVPFTMEEAFGGAGCAENPVGKGFVASGSDPEGAPLERLTLVTAHIDAPFVIREIACAARIPPHWEPRRSFGGTHDDAWRRTRAPLPPRDRESNHGDSVPQAFVHRPFLGGGEPIELIGFSLSPLVARVPRFRLQLLGVGVSVPFVLEQLELAPERQRATLTFAARVNVSEKLDRLQQLRIVVKRILTEERA